MYLLACKLQLSTINVFKYQRTIEILKHVIKLNNQTELVIFLPWALFHCCVEYTNENVQWISVNFLDCFHSKWWMLLQLVIIYKKHWLTFSINHDQLCEKVMYAHWETIKAFKRHANLPMMIHELFLFF